MMLSNAEVEGSNPAFKAGDAFVRSREDVSEDASEICEGVDRMEGRARAAAAAPASVLAGRI